MAEHFYGRITFPLYALESEQVKEALEEEGLMEALNGQGGYDTEFNGEDNLASFSCQTARNGEFEILEDALIDLKIPFNRYSSPYFEYDSENRKYRPARGDEEEIDATTYLTYEGYSYLTIDSIRELLPLSPEAFKMGIEMLIEKTEPEVSDLDTWLKSPTEVGASA